MRLYTFLLMIPTVVAFTFLGNLKLPKMRNIPLHIKSANKFGDKKLCIITGTSSGLGKQTAKALLKTGQWHVIGAVRDVEKMNQVAADEEFPGLENFTSMHCDLASFASVRQFAKDLNEFKLGRGLDRLVCNAAIYQPSLNYAKYTEDDIEQQMQTNHLSHFLLCSLMISEMKDVVKPRVILVGSVTGNDNTVGGGGVYPIANLGDLEGFKYGAKRPIEMIDGYPFNGAKAYKDSKMCIMMTANLLHQRYHRKTGITFASIYPGCIAESPLFREKRPWFRKYFPIFMKYITGGFVSELEAGQRLFQAITDPRCAKSGVYWSWNGGPREGRGLDTLERDGQIVGSGGAGGGWYSIFENEQSDKVLDPETSDMMWKYSTQITGAVWPIVKQPSSPCPTLTFIKFVTNILDERQRKNGKILGERKAPRTMGEEMD